jgi:hypothetical protein
LQRLSPLTYHLTTLICRLDFLSNWICWIVILRHYGPRSSSSLPCMFTSALYLRGNVRLVVFSNPNFHLSLFVFLESSLSLGCPEFQYETGAATPTSCRLTRKIVDEQYIESRFSQHQPQHSPDPEIRICVPRHPTYCSMETSA